MHYAATPANGWQPGDDVTVTATAQANYRFDPPAPTGWTRVNDTTETFVVHLDNAPDCRGVVTPETPTADPGCVPGYGHHAGPADADPADDRGCHLLDRQAGAVHRR